MREASLLAHYLRIRHTSSPINSTTRSKKKNNNSLPSSNSPQLQKIITNRRKKNNKLSSEPPKKDILIPPYSFCLCLSFYILYFIIIICLLTIKVNGNTNQIIIFRIRDQSSDKPYNLRLLNHWYRMHPKHWVYRSCCQKHCAWLRGFEAWMPR